MSRTSDFELRTVGESGKFLSEVLSKEQLRERTMAAERSIAHAHRLFGSVRFSADQRDQLAATTGLNMLGVARDPEDLAMLVSDAMNSAASKSQKNVDLLAQSLADDCTMKGLQADTLWARSAFPFIRIRDPKWAASLMATSVPKELANHIEPPWQAFRIGIPPGLVSIESMGADLEPVTRLMAFKERDGSWTFFVEGTESKNYLAGVPTHDLCDEVDERMNPHGDSSIALGDHDRRCMRLAGRLILGTCLAFDKATSGATNTRARTTTRIRGQSDPIIKTYVFGKPVKVDARPYVQAYLGGKRGTRGPQNIQSLVRGHWKCQPCGSGRADRRFIHIEPYWRGPEDGPILVRPHFLENGDA